MTRPAILFILVLSIEILGTKVAQAAPLGSVLSHSGVLNSLPIVKTLEEVVSPISVIPKPADIFTPSTRAQSVTSKNPSSVNTINKDTSITPFSTPTVVQTTKEASTIEVSQNMVSAKIPSSIKTASNILPTTFTENATENIYDLPPTLSLLESSLLSIISILLFLLGLFLIRRDQVWYFSAILQRSRNLFNREPVV